MIMPSKHITQEQALLGVGAVLLRELAEPHTVTGLWEKVRNHRSVGTYERFILALDMLYISGAVLLVHGMISRSAQ